MLNRSISSLGAEGEADHRMVKSTIRVLLIDDDEDDCFMLRETLKEVSGTDFSVEWASTYGQGVKALANGSFDVCIVDYRLGVQTGLDLLQEIEADGLQTPIILMTGYGEHDVDLEAMRLGAADYLVKDQINSLLLERSIRYSMHRAQAAKAILDREAQIMVQDRMASVGLLASSLAHEIGTPLGVIRGRAEYLELQLKGDPALKKNVDVIVSQIDRVSKLIRSLLNLARGDQVKAAERVSLEVVASEVLELMAHELRKHHIEVINELSGSMSIRVRAQAGPLHQVLLNLLVNSVHAIETSIKQGKKEGHLIRISARDLGHHWCISIVDSGCGIPEKNMKSLFTPFFTTKDIGVGTGLGLVTSYRILESWGGTISAKSAEGCGAEFQIALPKDEVKVQLAST